MSETSRVIVDGVLLPHGISRTQYAKIVSMSIDGATHKEIAAAIHLRKEKIGEALKAWTIANLDELRKHLRAFIDAKLAAGIQSIVLPKSVPIVRQSVLAEYNDEYVVTAKTDQFYRYHFRLRSIEPLISTQKSKPQLSTKMKQRIYAASNNLCVKCLKRPIHKRRKCVECGLQIRAVNKKLKVAIYNRDWQFSR